MVQGKLATELVVATFDMVRWPVCERCAEDGGIGVRLSSGSRCWAHADGAEFKMALERLGKDGRFDGRGVTFTRDLLQQILASAPPYRNKYDRDGHWLDQSDFQQATFRDDARFNVVVFRELADFEQATFNGRVEFSDSVFDRGARFSGAVFKKDVSFGP
jgi:hypothetical protein